MGDFKILWARDATTGGNIDVKVENLSDPLVRYQVGGVLVIVIVKATGFVQISGLALRSNARGFPPKFEVTLLKFAQKLFEIYDDTFKIEPKRGLGAIITVQNLHVRIRYNEEEKENECA